jgi:hypothetical protein
MCWLTAPAARCVIVRGVDPAHCVRSFRHGATQAGPGTISETTEWKAAGVRRKDDMSISAAPERAKISGPTAMDAEIAAVRRADWRFLLPIQVPSAVAYIGAPGAAAWASLAAFCTEITVLNPEAGPVAAAAPGFDFVMVERASPPALRLASALARPGGYVYAELDRRRSRRGGAARPPAGPARRGADTWGDPAAQLRRLGMADVCAHWHYPDFESCRCIIPAADLAAGVRHLRRGGDRALLDMLAVALRLPLSDALVQRLLPCVSVVARRPRSMERPR